MQPPSLRVHVTVDGFTCVEPVSNGLLDHGDNVWVECHARMFDINGPTGALITARSAIHGHAGNRRVRMRAGSRTPDGGIWRGDTVGWVPGQIDQPASFRMAVGTFDLVHGINALVVAPTIWRAHGDGDSTGVGQTWLAAMNRLETHTSALQRWVVGALRTQLSVTTNAQSGGRDPWEIDWFTGPPGRLGPRIPDGCDRPIGSKDTLPRGIFPPNVIVLAYANTRLLQEPAANLSFSFGVRAAGPGKLIAGYQDTGAAGHYTLAISAGSTTPSWQTPEPPAEGFVIGDQWIVREGRWSGVWRRRFNSDIFDAEWTDGTSRVSDQIELRSIEGTTVVLFRQGLNGTYTGTIQFNRRQIEGTASWYSPGETWTADIRGE
jgi:hypothetical protein